MPPRMNTHHKPSCSIGLSAVGVLRLTFLFGMLIVFSGLKSQNLVPNPSFEEYVSCPVEPGFSSASKPLHWENWLNSPDYFNSCAGGLNDVDTVIDVPLNGFGFQYAATGEAYVGMYTYYEKNEYREYVGAMLQAPLEVGAVYKVSFKTNLAWQGNYLQLGGASNNIGLLFTIAPNIWIDGTGPPFPLRDYAHLHAENVITDSVGWQHIESYFIADSAYNFIVLGNFFSNANTDVLTISPGTGFNTYYFVDDVSVIHEGWNGILTSESLVQVTLHKFQSEIEICVTSGFCTIQIYDALGNLISDSPVPSACHNLDVMGMMKGMYVLRLQFSDKIIAKKLHIN